MKTSTQIAIGYTLMNLLIFIGIVSFTIGIYISYSIAQIALLFIGIVCVLWGLAMKINNREIIKELKR